MAQDGADTRWGHSVDAPLHPSAARAATFNGSVEVDVGDASSLRLDLAVTAASGTTPTLDVKIQTKAKAADSYRDLPAQGAFAQKTGVATERKVFTGIDRFVRIVGTIGGTTPSFTFSVSGVAV